MQQIESIDINIMIPSDMEVNEKEFNIGDFVWARLRGSPTWPGRIIEPVSKRPGRHCVFLAGSHTRKWLDSDGIFPYLQYRNGLIHASDAPDFKEAVKEVEDLLADTNGNEIMICDMVPVPAIPPNTSPGMIGFLGLGRMGRAIIQNLIKLNFTVNVWDYSPSRCTKFILELDELTKKFVVIHSVPCEVAAKSDIIFSCLNDPRIAREVIYGAHGIYQVSLDGKGFIEMTTVNPTSSRTVFAEISKKGGRYLEAPIQGDHSEAINGSLVILAGGDQSLFEQCEPCFKVTCREAIYLGDIGYASKMNLVLRLIKGITLAGLAEALTLANRSGLYFKDIYQILGMTDLRSRYLMDKLQTIVEKRFEDSDQPLNYLQQDLHLALQLSEMTDKPVDMYMTSMAKEIFKHTKSLGYDKHDATTVYIRTQYIRTQFTEPDAGVSLS